MLQYVTAKWLFDNWGSVVRFFIAQQEICPDTHRLHLQAYIEVFRPVSMNVLKEKVFGGFFNHIHIETSRGTSQANIAYCTKLESRAPETKPTSFGAPARNVDDKQAGEHQPVGELIAGKLVRGASVVEVCQAHPSFCLNHMRGVERFHEIMSNRHPHKKYTPRSAYALVGPTGTGKSRWLWERFPAAYIVSLLNAKGGGKSLWYDGYQGQEVIVFSEMPCMTVQEFLTLCDPYPIQVQRKGGSVWWTPRLLFFVSNIPVKDWWADRNLSESVLQAVRDRLPPANRLLFGELPDGSLRRQYAEDPNLDDFPVATEPITTEDNNVTYEMLKEYVESSKDAVPALPADLVQTPSRDVSIESETTTPNAQK